MSYLEGLFALHEPDVGVVTKCCSEALGVQVLRDAVARHPLPAHWHGSETRRRSMHNSMSRIQVSLNAQQHDSETSSHAVRL